MSRINDFIKHRKYLVSVTENTLRWHRCALKWLPCENPTEQQLQQMGRSHEGAGSQRDWLQCCHSLGECVSEVVRITAQAAIAS
jgi:hypothetical protein